MPEPSGCQPAPSLASSGGQAGGHDTKEARNEGLTEGKDDMGKRFAFVIGVAAACVMALGAQTATSTTGPVDRVPPDLKLSGDKRQNPQEDRICDQQF